MSTPASLPGLPTTSIGSLANMVPSDCYPLECVETIEANGHCITVRPILPLDAAKFQAFIKNLSVTSRNHRFLTSLRELSAALLERLTQIDYRTHMALVAEVVCDGVPVIVAEARYAVDSESDSAELAVAVADELQGLGFGKALLRRLVDHAYAAGVQRLTGETSVSNHCILHLARKAGFSLMPALGAPGLMRLSRTIAPQPPLALPDRPTLVAAE
jgi:acetyltransferase